jgi:hypothetical protein
MGQLTRFGDAGTTAINSGVNDIFQALAKAPVVRQLAEQNAALRDAQAYSANMSGNKAGSEAENNRYTLDQRKGIPDRIAANPDLTDYAKRMYDVFQLTGDTNADRVAKAGTEFQTQGLRDAALDNVGDIDQMNRRISIAADKPYMPYDAVGNTGYQINKATGSGGVLDATLAKLFGNKTGAEINRDNAAAGLSNERRNAIVQGNLESGLDAQGNPVAFTYGTGGKVNVVPGITPTPKGSGADAALSKARARVVEQVYKDPMILPEDRDTEIEKRMLQIQGGAKSPAPSATAPTIGNVMPKGIPSGSVLVGTSGGKPVYQAPNGKKYIVE